MRTLVGKLAGKRPTAGCKRGASKLEAAANAALSGG
jgi:hypothetical protein